MTITPVWLGIDVSKGHLDCFDPQTGARRIANDEAAVAALADECAAAGRCVVFEATGHYDALLRRALEARGLRHARVNPERARDFAKAIGLKAKTDKIDARMLAEFGRVLAPEPRPPAEPQREVLALRHKRRDQLVAMRQQERTRRRECPDEAIAGQIDAHLAWLDEQIAAIESEIAALIEASAELRDAGRLLRSVPGIGPVTAATLLALMPELGQRSPKTIAALAGLAPFNVDSGAFKGKRTVRGGRKRIRDALYMAAVSASRTKTRLGAFCRKLRDAGKPPKLAFVALARKLIVMLNAIIRDKTEYRPA